MDTKKITLLHEEHKDWLSKLAFYHDELAIMDKRVLEIASKNTGEDVLKGVEHFQNQLIIQRNHIEDITHEVKRQEKTLIHNVKENPVAYQHRSIEDDEKLRDSVLTFEKIVNDLRHELNEFLSKNM
jgi:hypothetical protein